jgi:hypothetical protein
MPEITVSTETLQAQAAVNTHQYLVAAREGIDDVFGAGFAASPSIVGAYIQTCAADFAASCTLRAMEEIAAAIENKDSHGS